MPFEKKLAYHQYQARQEFLRQQRSIQQELENERAAKEAERQAKEAERQAKEAALAIWTLASTDDLIAVEIELEQVCRIVSGLARTTCPGAVL